MSCATWRLRRLVLPDFRTLRTWDGFPVESHKWDADDQLRRYARADLNGNISLRWIDSDEEIAHLEGWRGETWLHFSPGGRFLLAHNNGRRFRVWDLSASPPQLVQEGEQQGFVFHPDGRHLLIRPRNRFDLPPRFGGPQTKTARPDCPAIASSLRPGGKSPGRDRLRQSPHPGRQDGQDLVLPSGKATRRLSWRGIPVAIISLWFVPCMKFIYGI